MHIPESNPGRGPWTFLISKESEKKRQAKEETRKGKEAKEAEAKPNKDAKEKQKEKDTSAEVFVAVWWLEGQLSWVLSYIHLQLKEASRRFRPLEYCGSTIGAIRIWIATDETSGKFQN